MSNEPIEGRPGPARAVVRLALAAVALAAVIALAACGGNGIEATESDVEVTTAEAEGEPQGNLHISNWPFYIDDETVSDFQSDSGLSVNYTEDVDDNNDFFGKMQPLLTNGESGGRDIFIVTDWMVKKMYDLGYLQHFDADAVAPAMENLSPALESPTFDPEREYSLPWQSGMTGLVVNTAQAPDISSINDLFDPQYRGRVVFLNEMRDTVPLVMKADGIDPEDASEQDWLDAIDKIEQAAGDGQIRRFAGNGYTRDIANGDAVAAIGWSGDAVQLQADDPNVEFVMPNEGCMLWSDNMVIPVGAPNPTAAYEWMRYVYQPENQQQITEYVNYFTPVTGVRELFEEEGSELADSELIFPDDEFTANCSTQDSPPGGPEAEQRVEQAFEAVITG